MTTREKVRGGRMVRKPDAMDFCGLRETQFDALVRKGQFPRPIKISDSGRALGWLESELIAWRDERVAKRDARRRSGGRRR